MSITRVMLSLTGLISRDLAQRLNGWDDELIRDDTGTTAATGDMAPVSYTIAPNTVDQLVALSPVTKASYVVVIAQDNPVKVKVGTNGSFGIPLVPLAGNPAGLSSYARATQPAWIAIAGSSITGGLYLSNADLVKSASVLVLIIGEGA